MFFCLCNDNEICTLNYGYISSPRTIQLAAIFSTRQNLQRLHCSLLKRRIYTHICFVICFVANLQGSTINCGMKAEYGVKSTNIQKTDSENNDSSKKLKGRTHK